MGGDYYIDTYLVVKSNDREESILLKSIRGDFFIQYDSDSEGAYEREMEKALDRVLRDIKKSKVLYKNKEWLITSKEKVELYIRLILARGLVMDDVISIRKCESYRPR